VANPETMAQKRWNPRCQRSM